MVFIFSSLCDPEAEGLFFAFGETVDGVKRGHVVVFIFGEDSGDEFGLVWFAGDDGLAFGGSFEGIEAEIGFALVFIEAVAEEAVVGEDGTDVAVVADLLGRDRERGQKQEE